MAWAEVEDGVRLFYRDVGAGRPLVLLHGWTMTHQVFDHQVQDLAGEYRLVLPDLRGHGDSDKPVGRYDPDRHAADVSTLMDQLDLRDVTLIGWSFGGMTAMRVAQAYGERLSQLVLINAAGPKYLATEDFPHGHTEETLREWLTREREEIAPWRRYCMEAMPREPYDELFVDWLWAQSMRTPSWAGAPMLDAYARADLRDGLRDIRAETLILHGLHDVFCFPEAARYVAEHVDRAEMVEFPDSGHSPQWEAPEQFNRALTLFLARAR
jgi:pimeloyl-ACP methyl ester carboxylesterase